MRSVAYVLIVFFVSGCASYRPIVDTKGVNMQQYEQDLAECQAYAEQISPGSQALVGAGIGAGIGAAIGLALGVALNVDTSDLVGAGAAIGGVQGAAAGGAEGAKSQTDVIRNCMSGRGYKVLR